MHLFTIKVYFMRLTEGRKKILISTILVGIMVFSSFALSINNQFSESDGLSGSSHNSFTSGHNFTVNLGPREYIPYHISTRGLSKNATYYGMMNVMITFKLQNTSSLNLYLSNLQNPSSQLYHKYLTREQFASEYSASKKFYSIATEYFSSFPYSSVKTYNDRISLMIRAPSSTINRIFHTQISESLGKNSVHYFATIKPSLPSLIGSEISQISGLNNTPVAELASLYHSNPGIISRTMMSKIDGYPAPINNSGVQYLYGSDLQVAYCAQPLYNVTYPTNEVVATILWAGNTSTGQPVGPFNPQNIYDYYNSTIPSGEPHATVHGVPIGGAAYPGKSADGDTSGVTLENTLDLEMVGSLAPGSNIYNVYGPSPTEACLNGALAYILNPNSTASALNRVSVISNSWGTPEFNDTAWYEYLQEAQVRGISVLASSGDSGDNPGSSSYSANTNYTGDFLNFPASMAYNNFGITSVGGTTLSLTGNLHIKKQTAWYEIEKLFKFIPLDPVGSVGGISSVFPETAWQKDTEANNVIQGKGLGVPDIAALANNTLMCATVNGRETICSVAGTSVASPTEAGIIADINAVLAHYNQSPLGYLNPIIYPMANEALYGPSNSMRAIYKTTLDHQTYLPLNPFYDVHQGGNDLYKAVYGYNLVTGWGSIYAYNFTQFVLRINFTNLPYAMNGIENVVNISTLNLSSGNGKMSMVQSFYVSDELKAPVYMIESEVSLSHGSGNSWTANLGLKAGYPYFSGIKSQNNYEYSVNKTLNLTTPAKLEIKTYLSSSFSGNLTVLKLDVNGNMVEMPLPGGAFIIGSRSYSYTDQYSGVHLPDLGIEEPGYLLDPQFSMVSGIKEGKAIFSSPTSANVTFKMLPYGRQNYVNSTTVLYNANLSHISRSSSDLQWKRTGHDTWHVQYENGAANQGIYAYLPSYDVVFRESGLPPDHPWNIKMGDLRDSSSNSFISIALLNGTYEVQPGDSSGFYYAPQNYSFSVSGKTVFSLPVEFQSMRNNTLLRPIASSYGNSGIYMEGSSINAGSLSKNKVNNGSSTLALDERNQRLFTLSRRMGMVDSLNITNDKFYKKINLGLNSDPSYITFNNYTNLISVFSNGTGNVTLINPATLSIEKNITISSLTGYDPTMVSTEHSDYVILFSPDSQFFLINESSGKINNPFSASIKSFRSFSPYYTYENGFIYALNQSSRNVEIMNVTTGSSRSVPVGGSIIPFSIFSSGASNILFISGRVGNSFPILSFNTSSKKMEVGPNLGGFAIASSHDPLNGLTYVNEIGNVSEFWIINPKNLSIEGSAPYIIPDSSVAIPSLSIFDLKNQYIYAVDPEISAIYVYNVQHFYATTFTEGGLPASTAWYLNLTGRNQIGPVTSNTLRVNLHNGTFTYTAYSQNNRYILFPYNGTVTVNGKSQVVSLAFDFSYPIIFHQIGLPSGINWYVNVTGLKPSGPVQGRNFTTRMPNGTSEYHVATSLKIYAPYFHSNSTKIDGHGFIIDIGFYLVTFNVTFTENGLTNHTKWEVLDTGGTTETSVGTELEFKLPNGTYNFSIPTLRYFYNVIGNITVIVHGKTVDEMINYYHFAYISGNLFPSDATLTINGKVMQTSGGAFNISVEAGYFQLKATRSGYNYFHSDFSLRPGKVIIFTIKLSKVPTLTPEFYLEFYGAIGAVIALMIIGSIYLAIRKK